MTVLLRQLSVNLDRKEDELPALAARKLRVRGELDLDRIVQRIVKKSLDMRRGRAPQYLYSLALDLPAADESRLLARGDVVPFEPPQHPTFESVPSKMRPVVLGAGPAGLLAAYRLAQAGVPAVVLERGLPVKERSKQWYGFLKGGPFDSESNLLFGEGGAGTYSDGKLYTRVHDPRGQEVLDLLVECGAPGEIAYDAKPHIGSNLLPSIVRRLRERLIAAGIEFRFSTILEDLHVEDGVLRGVVLRGGQENCGQELECDTLFLGPGHSARDTLRMLRERGVAMSPKPFQIGARVEHPQSVIHGIQYRQYAGHENLPPAEYRMVSKLPGGDVFSFCMCPGGEILPSTEKEGFLCVNGASRHQRIGRHANSGFVITLTPDRFPSKDLFAGIALQEDTESRAAKLAEHPFGAPALRLGDFLEDRISRDLPDTSYPLPLTAAPFAEFLPREVHASLKEGLAGLCRRFRDFGHPDGLIVGPESRSSCPIRIERDRETYESSSTQGLYPIGEGAGHAGGILSAAMDGMRAVEAWLETRVKA